MKRWDIVLANDEAERPSSGPRRTAFDVRGEHRVLAGFSDEELAALALVPEGTGLRRYGLYLDLHDPGRAEFLADGAQTVKPGQRLVAREGTDERLWTALQQACGNVVGRRRAG